MFSHALVVGKFAPLHRGHQRLLDAAGEAAREVTVVVWSNPDFADMANETRAGWVRELYPRARVLVAHDGPPNDRPDHVHREYVRRLLAGQGLQPDVVVSAEAYGDGLANHLGAAHLPLDRSGHPEWSGTAIRAAVHDHRDLLDPRVYRHFVERVVFLGAESTGKTTLTRRMAEVYNTVSVDEYGREHYEARGGELTLDDYVTIARVHREREDAAMLRARRYVFVDTNAVTTMFFSHYYNRESLPELRVLAEACASRYQQVFVCDDDIPFEQDGWRDNAVWRARMAGMVLYDLAVRATPYVVVRGNLEERVAQVSAVLGGDAAPFSSNHNERPSTGPRPAS